MGTWTAATRLTIYRDVTQTQETDLRNGDTLDADVLEEIVDRQAAMIQEIQESTDRRITVPISDTSTDLEIPEAGERANNFLAFDASGNAIAASSVTGAPVTPYMETVLDDTDADTARGTLGVTDIVEAIYKNRKFIGELFWLDDYKAPAEYVAATPDTFFPAVCLSSIETKSDIAAANYPDLVTHLRGKRATYLHGKTGAKYAFDVTNWAIAANVATLTLANTTAENKLLAALAEEELVHGSYTNWMTVTLGSAIGDITAGDYAITEVDTVSRLIKFAFVAGNNSGAGAFTVSLYPHRIAGSTTTARLFEVSGRTIVSQGDADGEGIAGLRRRDRMQGHWHNMSIETVPASILETSDQLLGHGTKMVTTTGVAASQFKITGPLSDGVTTPRQGATSDARSLIGHLYIWAGNYAA